MVLPLTCTCFWEKVSHQSCLKPTFDFLLVYSSQLKFNFLLIQNSPLTVIPMLRAVPATIFIADSIVKQFKSVIFSWQWSLLFPGNFCHFYDWAQPNSFSLLTSTTELQPVVSNNKIKRLSVYKWLPLATLYRLVLSSALNACKTP